MLEEKYLLDEINKNYHFNMSDIKVLREGGCVSYIASNSNEKYFVKIISNAFADTAKQSVEVLLYLHERQFPVPEIMMTLSKKPYTQILVQNELVMLIMLEYIEGREPDEMEGLEKIGELTGNMHKIMSEYKGILPKQDKRFFIDRYIELLKEKNYDPVKIADFIRYGEKVWSRVELLPKGFSHGDLHRGNILVTKKQQYYFLDFDTSSLAFPMYDIMVMCNRTDYFNFNKDDLVKSKNALEQFLVGYLKYREVSVDERNSFYDLIGIYHYQLQATIIEIYGLKCIDEAFIDSQLEWLMKLENSRAY